MQIVDLALLATPAATEDEPNYMNSRYNNEIEAEE